MININLFKKRIWCSQSGGGNEKIELGDITQGRLVANFVQMGNLRKLKILYKILDFK